MLPEGAIWVICIDCLDEGIHILLMDILLVLILCSVNNDHFQGWELAPQVVTELHEPLKLLLISFEEVHNPRARRLE